jgi:hypothetical protein
MLVPRELGELQIFGRRSSWSPVTSRNNSVLSEDGIFRRTRRVNRRITLVTQNIEIVCQDPFIDQCKAVAP